MNKKLIALTALVLVAAGVILAGCSANGTAAPAVTVTETYQDFTNDTPTYTDEDKFLAVVAGASKGNTVLDNSTDEALLNAGWATCEVFDSGYSLSEVITTLVGTNPSSEEAYAYGVVIGAAATTLCPEYAYKVSSGA